MQLFNGVADCQIEGTHTNTHTHIDMQQIRGEHIHTHARSTQESKESAHTHLFMCADNLRKIIINYASRRPFKVHLAKRERIIEMAQQRERGGAAAANSNRNS